MERLVFTVQLIRMCTTDDSAAAVPVGVAGDADADARLKRARVDGDAIASVSSDVFRLVNSNNDLLSYSLNTHTHTMSLSDTSPH